MYYPESESFAAKHPDARQYIVAIDGYLHDMVGYTLDVAAMASILRIQQVVAERVLGWYAREGVLVPIEDLICPHDGAVLESAENGLAHCDICDEDYDPEDCESELRYHVLERSGLPTLGAQRFPDGHALLIGIDAYAFAPLAKAAADARSLHDLLVDANYAGYPKEQVRLLVDHEATKVRIDSALEALSQACSPDSTVVISFAGHGLRRLGGFAPGEYLCPIDLDMHNQDTFISTQELSNALKAIPAHKVLVILDACHSGGVGSVSMQRPELRRGLSQESYDLLAGSSRAILAACKPNELSYELPGMSNGLFTHYILEGLRGCAADDQGFVRLLALSNYVANHVSRRWEKQHPYFKFEAEDFVISRLDPRVRP